MKKLKIKTDKMDYKSVIEVSIEDKYYDFLKYKLDKIKNQNTQVVETKSLIFALIQTLLDKKLLEEKIDEVLTQCQD